MLRRLFLLSVIFGYSTVQAQPVVRSANQDSIRTIIVKFRSLAAMSDSSVLAQLRTISASSDIMRPVFARPMPPTNFIQRISTDTIGLNRIIQIPLREGITAQDAVRELSSRAEFEYVEPNYRYHIQKIPPPKEGGGKGVVSGEHIPNDPLFYAQWWLENVHAPEAWQITEGDSTIHIGFVDTGVNWLHPDLEFQFAVNPAEDINHDGLFEAWPSDSLGVNAHGDTVYGDLDGKDHDGNGYANDVIGYNFVSHEEPGLGDASTRGPIPKDLEGHGTDMAGILAAEQDNHIGISGIAPKCRLVALRAFNADGTGSDDDIATAIVYAADNHIQILSLSFGDIIPSLMQRDAIRYAISKGVTIFGSSGNDGSTGPNYPSDFDEVISVGASPRSRFANFTTHGPELDVVAPGVKILTTTLDGGYDSVSGTSAASPIAAGIAALLLSKNPKLTPIELRSIIESTTLPVGDRSYTSNGQVDAYAALSYQGSAQIKMVTPHTLDEFHIGDTIPITGSAMSTLFTGYSLSWSKDYHKDSLGFDQFGNHVLIGYDSVVSKEFDTSNSQVLSGTLGTLDTHNLDTGIYTISFAVGSSDNRSTQERCNIRLESVTPKFVLFSVDSIWVNTDRGLLIQATTNIPAQLEIHYAAPGAKVSTIGDDKIGFEHAILIQREQAQAGVPLLIEAILRSPNGDSSILHTTATLLNDAVPEDGFVEKPYTLPPGFALDSVLSVPTGDQVIETPNESGIVTAFQFDSTHMKFRVVDSIFDRGLPRALGDALGDGRAELLVQGLDTCTFGGINKICGSMRVYRQNAAHSLLGDLMFENDTEFGSTFARLLGGHAQQFVGVIDSAYFVWNQSNGHLSPMGSMVNVSPTDPYNTSNFYSEPHAAHADLRGNDTEDLITLDDDADLIVYERDASAPTGFRAVFIDSNVAQSNGAFVTTGDFDGDGKQDIAYAFHPVFQQDTLDEYHPAYWTLKVLRNLGDMKFAPMTVDHFYGANQNDYFYRTSQMGSIGRITNVTGHAVDDLAVSFMPNFYLLEYDSTTGEMRPIWRYPISQSPRGAVSWDFDRNGKREFGFFTGDSIRFFEHSDAYTEQTPAPAGLMVSPRDTNRVDLEWAPVEGATNYFILRALPGQNFTVIDSTQSTFYSDTTVSNGDDWLYSVAAFAAPYSTPYSLAAYYIEVIVHPMPRLVSGAMQSQNSVFVRTSQPPSANRLFAGTIMVDDTVQPDAIVMSSDSELVMNLPTPLTTGDHRMRVTSFGLRDIYNSPFDTADYLAFQVPPDTAPDRFYIVRWTFDQGPNGIRIHVIFNEQPNSNAFDVSHYTLSPYGTLTGVQRDSLNPNALFIDVGGDVKLVALGVPWVLCVTNIVSIENTPLDATNGNCAGVSLVEPDLSSVMVYPNPAKSSEGQLTFARLTAQADIRIYTMNMRFIRHLTTTESQGGVTWDLRDDAGNLVPSGEYLYYATGSNDAGVAVEGKAAKFVIVNDQK